MKKYISIALLVFFGYVMTSCNKTKENVEIGNLESPAEVGNITIDGDYRCSTELIYNVIEEKYIDDNIQITYPQITNLVDENKQNILNEIIKNSAYGYLKELSQEEYDKYEIRIGYLITLKSSRVLSIQFVGDSYYKDANHPNAWFYTVNIDIDNEKVLRLSDLINIDENFVLKFKNGELISPTNEKMDRLFKPFSNKDWIEMFNNSDSKKTEVCIYLTEDSLGISTPIAHASGDHAEIEIKYNDIHDSIKDENELWKYLLNVASRDNNKD